jgi:cob(I)alamin adenosyltransferase
MGNRLSRIYTRTGDDGTTGLGDGSRTAKDSARVEAIGAVDELNSAIGLLLTEPLAADMRELLLGIQHTLFDLGGELSIPGHSMVTDKHVDGLEQTLDRLNSDLAPLKEFILPGGTRAGALCHLARTVCRRAERRMLTLSRETELPPPALRYLNRLSDLLFVAARHINKAAGEPDVLWRRDR